MAVKAQTQTSQKSAVTARSSFWTLVTEPPTTPPLRKGNDPCKISGSVQLAGDISATNSYYVYKNLYEDTKPGAIIGTLEFASGRPDLVILSRMQNDKTVIGWDRHTRDFTLLRPLQDDLINSTGQETQVVFRCMPRENTNLVYYIFYLFNIIDVNDNKPKFTKPMYRLEISEAAPVGTVLSNDIYATDPDTNSQLSYWLEESPDSRYFNVDSASGQLSVKEPLDYEFISKTNITVWVKDTPTWCELREHPCVVFSASATIQINVIDIDDQPPVFTAPIYYGYVQANATYGTMVQMNETILATDGDMFISIPVVYSLHPTFLGRDDLDSDPRPYFMINERTGEVYVSRTLPSTVEELVYTVKAAQLNNSAKSSVAMLRITIGHHVIRFLGRSKFDIDVTESAFARSRIFYAPVITENGGGPLTYSIYGRDPSDSSLVSIDSSGMVTLTRSPSYSYARRKIPFVITATDPFQQSATAELVINVQPTFSRLPRFSKSEYIFNVTSREKNTLVGVVELDNFNPNDPYMLNFTYDLNAEGDWFTIDQLGVIRIRKYLSADTEKMEIVVTALDQRHLGDSAVVSILLPARAGSAIEQRGSQDMSDFLVYILATIAAVLMAIVLALGVYLLRSEKQIREMQRRILGTTLESDSHVKWLSGGGPSTSSGEIGPVDPAILRTNEAYQRFLEGGSSEEVQSSGAESLDYGRSGVQHRDREKMLPAQHHHHPVNAGGISSGYSSTASPQTGDIGQVSVTVNSGHHPFTPQTPPTKHGKKNGHKPMGEIFTALTSVPNAQTRSNGNVSNQSSHSNNSSNGGKRRYKKKYEVSFFSIPPLPR